jgi:serine/threonine protein phosphatase PrpC
VELLTIGAFARAARLTPKALRLYDELGILPPAAVDAESGYRLYHPDQLDRARLVAELRRIDMPLAQVRTVCGLPPDAAAEAVAAYWQQVADATAARARLAAVLVEHLSERGTTMSDLHTTPTFRHASGCDAGVVRDGNEDAAYSGDRLLAVADGMRGPRGAAASTAAVDALRALEASDPPTDLTHLTGAVTDADRAVRALADGDDRPITTLTAILRRDDRLTLVHVGDSRAYLLRDGDLVQLTRDHTWVQSQVDSGRLGHDEAAAHPDRALLVRALGAGTRGVEADLALRTAVAGDRYLLCTDGLSTVVDRGDLHGALAAGGGPAETVRRLIELAHERGAPDNLACVVADVVAGEPAERP